MKRLSEEKRRELFLTAQAFLNAAFPLEPTPKCMDELVRKVR